MLQQLKNIYRSLPPWSTAFLKYVPDGVLFGKSFRTCTPCTDLACIGPNLKRALDYAREHTVWGREHIPATIAASDAEKIVADLPCVGSEELRADAERFVSDMATKFNFYWTTTGETGKNPTNVRLSNSAYGIEWAHMLSIWRLGGYRRRQDAKLTLRGYHFRPGELMRYDPIYHEIGLDPFQIDIVGTSFVNPAMPLVNYRTGDFGKVITEGDARFIERLQGRSGKDFVYETRDVRYPITAINLPGDIQDKIVFYQVIQDDFAKIDVLVLPKAEWKARSQDVANELRHEISKRLSRFAVNVRLAKSDAEFERSKRGKFRMLVISKKIVMGGGKLIVLSRAASFKTYKEAA